MLISLLITLLVVGLVLYIVGLLPIDPTIKKILYAVVVVVLVIWLLQHLGGWHGVALR